MADMENTSPLAPTALPPSVQSSVYERTLAPDRPGGRGPLRFEEGLATDSDLPTEFVTGMRQGYVTAPGRPNRNMNVYEKWPAETLRERIHVGSAAWVEAPTYLSAFARGTSPEGERQYIQVNRSGARYERRNPGQVLD